MRGNIKAALVCSATVISGWSLCVPAADAPHSVSASLGVVSNYIWRGVTQTDGKPAVQGSLDYAHSSGFSAGTWVSNVDFGDDQTNYEIDFYAGFGRSLTDDLSYNLRATYIAYPQGSDLDFAELDASATYRWLTAGIAYTVYGEADDAPFDEGDLYYYGKLDFELPYELGLNLHGGYYDFKYSNGNSYGNWGASISRAAGDFGSFSLNYDQNGGNNDLYDTDPIVWVGWLKQF